MARKTEKYELKNVDLVLDARHLLHCDVPVNYYPEKGAEAIKYTVHIQFKDFADLVNSAIGKVKHAVGHAIREKEINEPGSEKGITTVDSTGYPPKSAVEQLKDLTAAVENNNPSEREALEALLKGLLAKIQNGAPAKTEETKPATTPTPPAGNRNRR